MRCIWTRALNWPSTPHNHLVPWYVALRRLLFCPLVFAGIGLAFVGLALGWGRDEAMRFWQEAR